MAHRNKQAEILRIQARMGELAAILPQLPWHGLVAVRRHINAARLDVSRVRARLRTAQGPARRRAKIA